MPSLSSLFTCKAQISLVKSLGCLLRGRGSISVLVGRACMRDEYSKHSFDPNVGYITACECRKLVSLSKEAFSEPIVLYYECNKADDVPGYSVELFPFQ